MTIRRRAKGVVAPVQTLSFPALDPYAVRFGEEDGASAFRPEFEAGVVDREGVDGRAVTILEIVQLPAFGDAGRVGLGEKDRFATIQVEL